MYDFAGFLSAFFVSLSLIGILLQIKLILRRKKLIAIGELKNEEATSVLSLIRFATSFLAFFTMYFYGLTLIEFNPYLVWPRVFALFFLLVVMYFIKSDRKDFLSIFTFYAACFVVFLSIVLGFSEYRSYLGQFLAPQILVVIGVVFLVYGFVVQILKIRKSGEIGALSLAMHQLYFVKDFSSVLFGTMMGLAHGWPVLIAHGISMVFQLLTMWHFRWVRLSGKAKKNARQL